MPPGPDVTESSADVILPQLDFFEVARFHLRHSTVIVGSPPKIVFDMTVFTGFFRIE